MKRIFPLLILPVLMFLLSACGTLNKTGVYQSDKFLYDVELAIPTAYDVIHAFVTWEKNNRPALAKHPEITNAADIMRANSPRWFASANALHDTYKANPTDANKSALQLVLDELRTAMTEATGYMVQSATTK